MNFPPVLFAALFLSASALAQEAKREAVAIPDFSRCQPAPMFGALGAQLNDKGELQYFGNPADVVRASKSAAKDEIVVRSTGLDGDKIEVKHVLEKKSGLPHRISSTVDTSWWQRFQAKRKYPNLVPMKSLEVSYSYKDNQCQIEESASRGLDNKLSVNYDRKFCSQIGALMQKNGGLKKIAECGAVLGEIIKLTENYNRANEGKKVLGFSGPYNAAVAPKPGAFEFSKEAEAWHLASTCRNFEIFFDKSPFTEQDYGMAFAIGMMIPTHLGEIMPAGKKTDKDRDSVPAAAGEIQNRAQ